MYPIENIKKEIKKDIKDSLPDLKNIKDIKLEVPPDKKIGDFAFPCFQLSPIMKKSPKNIAEEIKSKIKSNRFIKKIQVINGYVNFYLDEQNLNKIVFESISQKEERYGYHKSKNKKVIVEHTSANPNGPLHVGRARNPIIGDTIVRISKAAGYKVESQFYLDDMGKQVAILTWGLNNLKREEITKTNREKPDHKAVGYYQKANELLEKNLEISEEIQEIIKKSERGDQKTIQKIHRAYKPVLKGMIESLKKINIIIDTYVPESKFVEDNSVDKIVEKLKKSNYSEHEEGAHYIDMEPYGIKGRNTKFFFLRKDGTTLYATRDIAYHKWKADHADILINVLGEDHKLESKQVETSLKILKLDLIPRVIFYSFVSLPGGKMSTRRARVVYLDDLIDESIKRAYIEVKKRRGHELSEEKMKEISDYIGIGALRYNIIKVQPEKSIVFKWDEALNFEGHSAPFIQYAHARVAGILSKNKDKLDEIDSSVLNHYSEIELIKKIAFFPEIIKQANREYKPHLLANYLFEIASQFNQFYRDCPVIYEEKDEIRKARLFLVKATKIVIRNGLKLLGITAPDEM